MNIPWGNEMLVKGGRYGERIAILDESGTYNYAQLANAACSVCHTLRRQGIAPGEPVGIYLENGFSVVCASYGVILAGAAETPLDFNYTPTELTYCINLLSIKHIITSSKSAHIFTEQNCTVHLINEMLTPPRHVNTSISFPEVNGNLWGRIMVTSGTTGYPKAIVNSHKNRWLANILLRAHLPFQPDKNSRLLLVTPFGFGASLLAYAFLDSGASVYMMKGIQIDAITRMLEDESVNAIFAPPTVLQKLALSLDGRKFTCIKTIFCGTSTLLPNLYHKIRAIFGPVVRITYGKSEIYNPITILSPEEADVFYSHPTSDGISIGWPASGIDVDIRNEEGTSIQGTGEIFLRAQHMMIGHVDASGFHELQDNEWHATGDMGHINPNGNLFITGRSKDAIKTGGYKVYPQEIEVAIPECTVIGIPSEYWGQVIVAITDTPYPNWIEQAKLQASHLAKFKRPRIYISISKIPRGAQNKTQRNALLNLILQNYILEDGPYPQLIMRR